MLSTESVSENCWPSPAPSQHFYSIILGIVNVSVTSLSWRIMVRAWTKEALSWSLWVIVKEKNVQGMKGRRVCGLGRGVGLSLANVYWAATICQPLCCVLSLWRWSGHRLCSSGAQILTRKPGVDKQVCSVNSVLSPMMATDKAWEPMTLGGVVLATAPLRLSEASVASRFFHSALLPHGHLKGVSLPCQMGLCEDVTPECRAPVCFQGVVQCSLSPCCKRLWNVVVWSQWGHVYQMYITL